MKSTIGFEIGNSYRITQYKDEFYRHALFGSSYEIHICNNLGSNCELFGFVYHDSLRHSCISQKTINENLDLFRVVEIEPIEIDVKNYNWSEV